MPAKKILLLSGYDAASHKYWRNLLCQKMSQFEWTQLALPDRNFSWRVRGSSLNFATQYREELSQKYDLILATSMVDLASLKGFVPELANVPCIVYFHENQFAYPISSAKNSNAQANAISAQLTSIYSALCATKILFNSEYNRTTFLSGARQLFKRLPDDIPSSVLDNIEVNSEVIAVPITFPFEIKGMNNNLFEQDSSGIPHIVWNHRWEYDKQPQVFFDALRLLKKSGQLFKLHVLGQSFRQVPDCFSVAEKDFSDEILSFGFQSKKDYQNILNRSDIAVSSALHDFQGLSLLEAMSRGCVPIAPKRVAYPEYVDAEYLYSIENTSQTLESESLFKKLVEVITRKHNKQHDLNHYSCDYLLPAYQEIFETEMKVRVQGSKR